MSPLQEVVHHPKTVSAFLALAGDVARFYGFRPVRDLRAAIASVSPEVAGAAGEPFLGFYAAPVRPPLPMLLSPREAGELSLVIAGPQGSVGEVMLIQALCAIAREWGAHAPRVRVNALGDRDSKLRFARELSAYLRKHSGRLDEHCRQKAVENPLAAYLCGSQNCRVVLEEGPRAVNFLSEKSRERFREMLEHLEHLRLHYELDDLLIWGDEAHSAFAIDLEDSVLIAGRGGRFDDWAERLAGRRELELAHGRIFFRRKGVLPKPAAPAPRAPRLYFVQLGTHAKLESLNILESLYRARIPVLQSFDASRLAPQLTAARAAGVSHLIIMGQREALDRTVIVRSMEDSAQEIVPHRELTRYLKTFRV